MIITLTNGEWYSLADTILNNPIGDSTYIPVMYNFYIQKNINKILELKEELDNCRRQIISHYGIQEDNGIRIATNHVDEANAELKQLSIIESSLELYVIPLEAFKDIKLTTGELKGLMPMIVADPSLTEHLLQNPETYSRTIVGTPRVKGDK